MRHPFQLLDRNGMIYRSELLDAAACACNSEKAYAGSSSGKAKEAGNIEENEQKALRAAAARTISDLWKFCQNRFEEKRIVSVRSGRNRSTLEASLSDWWDIRQWLMNYCLSDSGRYLLDHLHGYCRKQSIDLPRIGIRFGPAEREIYNTTVYFRNQFHPEWMRDELNQRMILGVDRSKVEGDYSIISPVLGNISPFMLSGGVKTLILIHERPDQIYNASNCGDNCARWILTIGRSTDFNITLHHIMDFKGRKFSFYILNDGKSVNTMPDYIDSAANNLE